MAKIWLNIRAKLSGCKCDWVVPLKMSHFHFFRTYQTLEKYRKHVKKIF
jgi:hypothetical protein